VGELESKLREAGKIAMETTVRAQKNLLVPIIFNNLLAPINLCSSRRVMRFN